MQFKNKIIDVALLGTGKHQLPLAEMPAAIVEYTEDLGEMTAEEHFLKTSALALSYYRAGVQATKVDLPIDEALPEVLPYCSDKASSLLNNLLSEKHNTLLWFWAYHCHKKGQIVRPDVLPQFMDWGTSVRKHYGELISAVIGNRGRWLSKYNTSWDFVIVAEKEETTDWETANIKQRISYLQKLRETEPASVIEKIKSVWKEENAATRVELIATLSINVSKNDEAFLTECLTDKSKQVKEKALELLKSIPDSDILTKYKGILRNSIKLKESKLLGLISRSSIEIALDNISEDVFKTGIDKLSSDKKISDTNYILSQLIGQVPPVFWQEHFNTGVAEVVKLFVQKDEFKFFQSALCRAVVKFPDRTWALEILKQFETSGVSLLSILNENERQEYALKFVTMNLEEVINVLRTDDIAEWNLKLAQDIIGAMAQNPHRYNKSFFESISIYLPAGAMSTLGAVTVEEEWRKNFWSNNLAELERYIAIKETIKNHAF